MFSRSVVSDSVNPRTVAHQAPLSMEYFPGKNTGVGCHFLLTPEDLPNLGIKSTTPASPALAGGFFITVPPEKPTERYIYFYICHSILYSSQDVETTYMPSTGEWIKQV